MTERLSRAISSALLTAGAPLWQIHRVCLNGTPIPRWKARRCRVSATWQRLRCLGAVAPPGTQWKIP